MFGKLLSDEESGEDRLEENGEKQDEDAAVSCSLDFLYKREVEESLKD